MRFAEQFKEWEIASPLAIQLSWSRFTELLPLETYETNLFYTQLSVEEKFGKRELRKQIAAKAFGWTGIANIRATQKAKGSKEHGNTRTPVKRELEKKLHLSLRETKERLERRKLV